MENKIRIIHHGIAIPERRLENTIFLVKLLDRRYKLDLMLMPYDRRYMRKLGRLTNRNDRVRIIKPIPFEKIPLFLNSYDMGIFLLPPRTLQLPCGTA